MNENFLRSVIRGILSETRANLSIRPMMKAWWEVASKYGVPNAKGFLGMSYDFKKEHRADVAALRVPEQHKNKVFDKLTPEAQEWVLKHWKTKEYFGNMIKGVTLAVIKKYPDSTAIGRKSGYTQIGEGTWNDENKTWTGGMLGYLTMKSTNNQYRFQNLFAAKELPCLLYTSDAADDW